MAGDQIVGKCEHDTGEQINDNCDVILNLHIEEEIEGSIQYTPCPEFQFCASTCYICNGYYGPCFEEPVCATCHAFLFPNDIGLLQVPIFSEKTDDEDSGNDEPTDLYYNHERRTSQQQQSSPQSVNPYAPIVHNASYGNVNSSQLNYLQLQNVPAFNNHHVAQNNLHPDNGNKNVLAISQHSQTVRDGNLSIQSTINRIRNNLPHTLQHSHNLVQENVENTKGLPHSNEANLQHLQELRQFQWNCRMPDHTDSSRAHNLSERLEMLSNPKHIEHEPINEPGLVERLPPEVLLAVFSHLDDVSLWSAANVCRRWCGLLSTHITSQQWQQNVKLRWPLYRPIGYVRNWYKVYDHLASSAPCRTCLAQSCLQSTPPRMEENSWRRNRLRNELKGLRIDPPEGIEATPLDQMCCHWQATITGPVGSPYEGGLFYLYLQVPYSYPMCPPVVRFLTKILHPNVSRHGDVGIDSIHHNWSLALTISKVLISVQSLLTDPYCQVCMEPELGEMYMNDREKFEEVARAWTWRYAMHDVITPF